MPYLIKKTGAGYTVVSPNHPEGHSKKPMTHENAVAQMLIMERSELGHKKSRAYYEQKDRRPE